MIVPAGTTVRREILGETYAEVRPKIWRQCRRRSLRHGNLNNSSSFDVVGEAYDNGGWREGGDGIQKTAMKAILGQHRSVKAIGKTNKGSCPV